jgi:hypothetical protein
LEKTKNLIAIEQKPGNWKQGRDMFPTKIQWVDRCRTLSKPLNFENIFTGALA